MTPEILITCNSTALARGISSVDDWAATFIHVWELDDQDMRHLAEIDGIRGKDGQYLIDRFNRCISATQVSSGAKLLLAVRRLQRRKQPIVINSDSCDDEVFRMLCTYLESKLLKGEVQHVILYASLLRSGNLDSFVFKGFDTGYSGDFSKVIAKEVRYDETHNGRKRKVLRRFGSAWKPRGCCW